MIGPRITSYLSIRALSLHRDSIICHSERSRHLFNKISFVTDMHWIECAFWSLLLWAVSTDIYRLLRPNMVIYAKKGYCYSSIFICTMIVSPISDHISNIILQMVKILFYSCHDTYFVLSYYHKVSNIRRTEFQNINDSRPVLQLSLPNLLKPCIKSRMKM